MNFDWSDLAFGSKKPIDSLKPMFIAAPRELSEARMTQLIKTYLPQGNIVLGLAKEAYIDGFEGQPQFRTLQAHDVEAVVAKVNQAQLTHRIATLRYYQRDLRFILEKLKLTKVLFINGSWKYLFHTLPPYYVLATRGVPYELLSPFTSIAEAQAYEQQTVLPAVPAAGHFTSKEMLAIAGQAATHSYDYGFQTGVALGRKSGDTYRLLATAFNQVVPYQTYAMHHGASREKHFSPMHDLNHYDTAHAEVALIIKAQQQKIDLQGTTLFINLLPCPACARMFTQTDIAECMYREDHSAGYGVKMLQLAGKKVTRIVE